MKKGRMSLLARNIAKNKIIAEVKNRRRIDDHSPIPASGLNEIAGVGDDRTGKRLVNR
jgi:hypothetical protein